MKRSFLPFAVLVLLASCTSETFNIPNNEIISHVTITAEDFEMDAETRTSLELTSSGLSFTWAERDVVGIYPNVGDQVSFPMTKGAGTKSANFDGGGWALKGNYTYAAYFPYNVDNTTYGHPFTALPISYKGQKQTENNSTAGLGDYDYMVATASTPESGNVTFNFSHVGSVLYIQLTTPDAATFTKLTLSADEAIFITEATLNLSDGTLTPKLTSNSISLDLENIAVEASGTLYAWMLIAPTDASNKTIHATLVSNELFFYQSHLSGKNFERGRAYQLISSSSATMIVHEYVDLDLPSGTLWATMNVGANSPEEYGSYFAWGETEVKDYYDWSNYKWCKGSSTTLIKYNVSSDWGVVDNKTILELSDDAAYVNWGKHWRIPTSAECKELLDPNLCSWTYETVGYTEGLKVTSLRNGNYIFLPIAGVWDGTLSPGISGDYWSSSLSRSHPESGEAINIPFGSPQWSYPIGRYGGRSVRPVYSDAVSGNNNEEEGNIMIDGHECVDLNLPSGTLWATCNVGANSPEKYGDYFAWGETDAKTSFSWSNYKYCDDDEGFSLSKYFMSDAESSSDKNVLLDTSDDAAHVNWGGRWRTPTDVEWSELSEWCQFEWAEINDIKGLKVKSRLNGRYIFLPTTSHYWKEDGEGHLDDPSCCYGINGYYWASSLWLSPPWHENQLAYFARIYNTGIEISGWGYRWSGHTVRPVCQP